MLCVGSKRLRVSVQKRFRVCRQNERMCSSLSLFLSLCLSLFLSLSLLSLSLSFCILSRRDGRFKHHDDLSCFVLSRNQASGWSSLSVQVLAAFLFLPVCMMSRLPLAGETGKST